MNDEIREIYLSGLEWTKTHDNMGGVTGNLIFKDNMSYEEYQKLLKTTYFTLCDKDYITNLEQETEVMKMDKPSKCKNCQWYGKPYWSIINPCDNCPMENIQTFTRWQDPTIDEYKKEIDRLNSIIEEIEDFIRDEYRNPSEQDLEWEVGLILDKIVELKDDEEDV